jgi:hypothetical protein
VKGPNGLLLGLRTLNGWTCGRRRLGLAGCGERGKAKGAHGGCDGEESVLESGLDAADEQQVAGYLRFSHGGALPRRSGMGSDVPNEAGRDHDRWLSAKAWLQKNR